jgi:hypothetical protein
LCEVVALPSIVVRAHRHKTQGIADSATRSLYTREAARPRGGAASTSQGHARTVFRRALQHDNLVVAEATAKEIGRISLVEALELTMLIARKDPRRPKPPATVKAMLYDVLVIKSGDGELRFTIERDAALSDGDTFEQDSTSYRVVSVEEGQGPFDATVIAEWLGG